MCFYLYFFYILIYSLFFIAISVSLRGLKRPGDVTSANMAAVKARGDTIALISGNQIKLHDFCKGTSCILHLPEIPNNAKNSHNDTENPPANTSSDDKNFKQGKKTNEKSKRTESKDSSENVDLYPNRTLSTAFSDSGQLLAISDDRKQLHLYKKLNSDDATTSWTLLTSRDVVRRSTSVLFTRDEKHVILGDKSGDVYKFSVIEPTEPGQLMMGHLSMLLDMVLADNDRYLVTCDRDEKIRVSHFPNTYNIHCYCLGHTDFLTCLVYVPEVKAIISGGGDGTIRSWDLEGKNIQCLNHGVTRLDENKEEKTSKSESNTNSSSSSNSNTNNNNVSNIAAIKCMAFDPCKKSLVVSFDQSTTLQLYKIEVIDEYRFEIKLYDQWQLSSEPWSIHFLSNSYLLVLSPLQESTVLLFDCRTPNEESSTGPKISEVLKECLQQQPKIQEFLKSVNSDWAFFEPSIKIDSLINSLSKSKIDNMSDYQERKEEQIKKKFQPKGKRKDFERGIKHQEPSAKAVKIDNHKEK